MKPLYPRLTTLIDGLEAMGARRGDPYPEGDGPGGQLAEEIRRAQDDLRRQSPDSSVAPQFGPDDEEGGLADPAAPIFWFPDGVDAEDVVRQLAGANGQEYRRLALLRGLDAHAWYMTFHQRMYQWGIYAPVTGVAAYAVHALSVTDIPWEAKLNVALRAILAHERFHFAADVGIAQVELALQRPIAWPARDNAPAWAQVVLIEEQLATAAQLRSIRFARDAAARASFHDLRAHSQALPPGYRDGHQLVARRHDFEGRMLDHAQAVWEAALGAPPAYGVELQHLYPAFRPYELGRCPVHVLFDQARYGLGHLPFFLISTVDVTEESPDFVKKLRKLPTYARTKWDKTRRLLAQSTSVPGLDFKPWPPGGKDCFSVRVDKTLRAHLRFDSALARWLAESIGFHGEMGHG